MAEERVVNYFVFKDVEGKKVDPVALYRVTFFRAVLACFTLGAIFALFVICSTRLFAESNPEMDKFANRFAGDPTFNEHYSQFKEFIKEFDRQYEDELEREVRFAHFRRNLRKIDELNRAKASGGTVEYGVNEFSDKSEDEVREMLLPLDFKQTLRNSGFVRPQPAHLPTRDRGVQMPAHFDWRDQGKVTPCRSQHHCGSCWAFATVGTVESSYAVQKGQLMNLSQQELLDCNLQNNACNGGHVPLAMEFVHEHGLMTADQYPYVAHRQNSCALDDYRGPTVKLDMAVFLQPDENAMIEWLLNYGPVNVGIAVPPDLTPYKGGVYRPSAYDCQFRVLGLHALNVVGYGTSALGEKYWIVKNSWGQKWGVEKGYVYFARGVNACGIEDQPVGVLV